MLSRESLVIAAIAVSLFVVACGNNQTSSPLVANANSPAAQSTPDQFAGVRTIYGKECRGCHGQNGEGGPVKLEDGTKLKVPTLREAHALRHPDSDFLKQITKGGDGMPAFEKKLTPEQMNDLIRFIREEFQKGAAAPAKAN
ncbi:MAG: cytochrome c [Pyrinomonadaceae bacterium]